jgi:3-methyladenine DNA glycosylase AlkD
LKSLLNSKIHEERLIAAFILVDQYKRGDEKKKKIIFNFYLKNRKGINNWDLVDLSAPKIVGAYLIDREKDLLYKFANSKDLWEKRISIISTQAFIREHFFEDTLNISKILLNDKHDLIHKAVGWMLREVGNRDMETEEEFLKKFYKKMPRTMLRYAIEKFPEQKRINYLKGLI